MDVEATSPAPLVWPRRWEYAEQRLYDGSPLGPWTTTAAIFALLVGLYAAAAAIDHVPWLAPAKAGAEVDRRAWTALCLSLIACAVLGLQRYSRLMDAKDAAAFARLVSSEVSWLPTFSTLRVRLFTLVGAAAGGAAVLLFVARGASGAPGAHGLATSAWFTLMAALLGALFFRGVELTGAATRHARRVMRIGLRVDLLRIEQLYPFGRAAGRTALIWFTVSAATLLMFAGSGLGAYTLALGAACGLIGAWVFVATLGLVHHEIRKAKAAELEVARAEIGEVRALLASDPAAPAKLQSLLAYEARIAAAPEWPFDQTMLVRVGASALILTVPWFGQALAGLVVDHLGKALS